MHVFYADHHPVPLPEGHRFPMMKYTRLRSRLLELDLVRPDELHPSDPAPIEYVRAAHTAAYVDAVVHGTLPERAVRALGFPWSAELVRRSLASVAGTVAAARCALDPQGPGIAGNLAGGTHHAFADRGEGFCVFNDLAVTTRLLLAERAALRVLVLDLDVHQGNGTASILRGESRAFTCSLHGERNYPFKKEQSDLDVGIPDGADDATYLAALRPALQESLERAQPGLILYQAGVDALREDRFGRLGLTLAGLRERDRLVLSAARAGRIPIALTLGGGYGEPLSATVEAYVGTYQVAREIYGD